MAFSKKGIATISAIKCSCGCDLQTVATQCPKCGKNLRPLSNPAADKKESKKQKGK